MRSDVFPVGLKLDGKRCLVVGTGNEADRRAAALLTSGAKVTVVSERPSAELERLAGAGEIHLEQRAACDADFDGAWLAVYTDMDVDVAARLDALATARRIFFCAVDLPAHSSYSHAALVKAGPVTAALSTDGRAPALARKLRDELARVFDEAKLDEFAETLASLRERTAPSERRAALAEAVSEVRFAGRLVLRAHEDALRTQGRNRP